MRFRTGTQHVVESRLEIVNHMGILTERQPVSVISALDMNVARPTLLVQDSRVPHAAHESCRDANQRPERGRMPPSTPNERNV